MGKLVPKRQNLPDWPAAMREDLAAAFLDISPGTFRAKVMPKLHPVRLSPGCILYRRSELQALLDREAGAADASLDRGGTLSDPAAAEWDQTIGGQGATALS